MKVRWLSFYHLLICLSEYVSIYLFVLLDFLIKREQFSLIFSALQNVPPQWFLDSAERGQKFSQRILWSVMCINKNLCTQHTHTKHSRKNKFNGQQHRSCHVKANVAFPTASYTSLAWAWATPSPQSAKSRAGFLQQWPQIPTDDRLAQLHREGNIEKDSKSERCPGMPNATRYLFTHKYPPGHIQNVPNSHKPLGVHPCVVCVIRKLSLSECCTIPMPVITIPQTIFTFFFIRYPPSGTVEYIPVPFEGEGLWRRLFLLSLSISVYSGWSFF